MQRKSTPLRPNWEKTIESQGFLFHSVEGQPYWDESHYYEFTSKEVDELEAATNSLHELCLGAVQHVIDNNLYSKLFIPDHAIKLIEDSWNNETPAIYGRFDFSYDGKSPPKMLEYNADTPTSLLEASAIQWYWMKDKFPTADQFNSIHDKLVAKWTELKDYLKAGPLYFTSLDMIEDYMNLQYMIETAKQGGLETESVNITDIGWDSIDNKFVDKNNYSITNIFKLYPWEWLLNEEFGENIAQSSDSTFWIEPPWKSILSNKGILPILWELNPGHPNLLPTFFDKSYGLGDKFVTKPIYSREGANITIYDNHKEVMATEGEYGEEGLIYQKYAPLANFDDNYPMIGSWVVDGESAGIGIREDKGLITGNYSRFVPHIFR